MTVVSLRIDPVVLLNERARKQGWTFVCERKLEFESPKLQAVSDLWQSRSAPGRLPTRQEFSARDLKDVLPNLVIMESVLVQDRRSFRFRYMGSSAVSYLGELTGRIVEDCLPASAAERTSACYQVAHDARCALRFVTRFSLDQINFLTGEIFAAPLASDGVNADMAMSVIDFHERAVALPARRSPPEQ